MPRYVMSQRRSLNRAFEEPSGGLCPAPARELEARPTRSPRLKRSSKARSAIAAGHDVSGHADPHRGPGPGRLPAHPRHRPRIRWPPPSTPTSCRTRRSRAFGRLALRDYYPQLTETERDEREQLWSRPAITCATASTSARSGRRSASVEECIQATLQSDQMRQFRTRSSPASSPRQGHRLWGSRVQKAYATWAARNSPNVDAEALLGTTRACPGLRRPPRPLRA